MARVIAVVNQKGGIGKTTTVVNLAALRVHAGKRVLIIDTDAQANATQDLGYDDQTLDNDEKTLSYALLGQHSLSDIMLGENLSIIPAGESLSYAELPRQTILRELLHEVKNDFAFILIDCGPTLTQATGAALLAADSLIIPIDHALEPEIRVLPPISASTAVQQFAFVGEFREERLELEAMIMVGSLRSVLDKSYPVDQAAAAHRHGSVVMAGS